jgi:hypothetical protein
MMRCPQSYSSRNLLKIADPQAANMNVLRDDP